MPQDQSDAIKFLFIAGCARSGTSVLRRLVNADPNAAIGLERYIHYLFSKGRLTPGLFEPERFLNIRKGDTFYTDFSAFPSNAEVIERYHTARIRGDKIPRIYDYYPELYREFPDARIIFILRNPVDVALSFERRARKPEDQWPARRGYEAAIKEWNRSVQNTLAWAERLNICVVSYENLFLEGVGVEELGRCAGLDTASLAMRLTHLREKGERIASKRGNEDLPVEKIRAAVDRAVDRDAYERLVAKFLCNPLEGTARVKWHPADPAQQDGAREPGRTAGRVPQKYVVQDREVIDYQCYQIGHYPMWVRGPRKEIDRDKPYAVVLGAASAFGRCVEHPYAELLEARLGMPVLNLGYGGAKPGLYLEDEGLRRWIGGAAVVITEFMSARGFPNSVVEARNTHSSFVRLRAGQPNPALLLLRRLLAGLRGRAKPQPHGWQLADRVYARLVRAGDTALLERAVAENREAYTKQMQQLLQLGGGLRILFWFAQRRPDYAFSTDTLDGLTGGFPHFVNGEVVSSLRDLADRYVELCSSAGLPSRMISRATGEPVALFPHNKDPSLNFYYPSQEMHEQAAELLFEAIAPLLPARSDRGGGQN